MRGARAECEGRGGEDSKSGNRRSPDRGPIGTPSQPQCKEQTGSGPSNCWNSLCPRFPFWHGGVKSRKGGLLPLSLPGRKHFRPPDFLA